MTGTARTGQRNGEVPGLIYVIISLMKHKRSITAATRGRDWKLSQLFMRDLLQEIWRKKAGNLSGAGITEL